MKKQRSSVILDLCLSKTRTWKSRDYGSAIVYGRRDNLFYRVHTTWFFFSDWTITSEAPRYPSRIVRRAVVSWTRNAHEMHEDKTCYSQFEYLFRGFLFFFRFFPYLSLTLELFFANLIYFISFSTIVEIAGKYVIFLYIFHVHTS